MKKVVIVKKETQQNFRRCLNCGADISNKRKDAQFCNKICYKAYYSADSSVEEVAGIYKRYLA